MDKNEVGKVEVGVLGQQGLGHITLDLGVLGALDVVGEHVGGVGGGGRGGDNMSGSYGRAIITAAMSHEPCAMIHD